MYRPEGTNDNDETRNKPGKYKRILGNWRPITLLNTDYKMFTAVLAARLKEGLSKIISSTQSGFLKGKSIHNNICLVLDLIDGHLINNDGFILFMVSLKPLTQSNTHLFLTLLNTFDLAIGF